MKTLLHVFFLSPLALQAQTFDLVLKGGHVIDPGSAIDRVMDVGITGDRVTRVAPNIDAALAKRVIDASGLYVTPGLIDLHAHVYGYSGSIAPDDTSLPAGTTTIVDAGGAGWRTFDDFKAKVIDRSTTRVLVFLNIVGRGMLGSEVEDNVDDMEPARTALKIKAHRETIVGIKTAHFGKPGWTAIKRAIEAGNTADVPVMVDDKIFTSAGRTTREKVLDVMRPGDLHTHMYNDRQMELVDRFTGKVQPYMIEARKRGVLFDLGHGGGSFLWPVAVPAMKQGFAPDTISTDLHSSSLLGPQSDMPNCISKMMNLGMTLQDAVIRSTVNPAKAIRRYPELGTLGEGKVADVAVFQARKGVFAYKDAWGKKLLGTQKLEPVLTIRAGKVVASFAVGPAEQTTEIYDLLLKNAFLAERGGRFDVAVTDAKIVKIGSELPASHARVVADLTGLTVAPFLAAPRLDYAAIRSCTAAPGRTLIAGGPADLAILATDPGQLRSLDGGAAPANRTRCMMTVQKGKVVWDSDGLAAAEWNATGPYSNFK